MITRVQIKNYRSIAEADVGLDRMTVLVGRNGSGKSSFVDAIKLVRDAMRVGLENAIIARNGFGSIRRWAPGRKRQIEIALHIERPKLRGSYELVLASDGDGFKIQKERGTLSGTTAAQSFFGEEKEDIKENEFERQGEKWITQPMGYSPDQLDGWNLEPTILALPVLGTIHFSDLWRSLRGNFYTIFPNTLREPQKPMTEKVLSDHGDNFISVLQHITRNKAQKKEIISVLSRVVEGVSDLRVQSAGSFLVAELQHQDLSRKNGNGESGPWFDLSQESDGTLRMLGLLAALYQSSVNELLALEEPEIALHPSALAILAEELQAASRRRQILVTTQSPDLIARVPASQLRVVERVKGETQILPLEESQRQIIEEQLFNAGDLLRIEGLRGAAPLEK